MTPPHSVALAARPAGRSRQREIDHAGAQRAARDLLRALGADVDSESLRDTPRRVADTYAELLPFHSLCIHHMLPFHGIAHVGYLPRERIIGLSKLGRVVELFARDLQIQERLTVQVADWLRAELEPNGVGVVLEAEHLCMSLRGVQKPAPRP